MNGNSSLYSARDINLYAGKLLNGNVATLDLDAEASDFNASLIPVVLDPTVNNAVTQNNQITIDNGIYIITEIVPLDCYLFRTCTAKMAQHGFAKELSIPVKNGELDSSAFTEMLAQIILDERQSVDWL